MYSAADSRNGASEAKNSVQVKGSNFRLWSLSVKVPVAEIGTLESVIEHEQMYIVGLNKL